jgi:20S proteasome alpha/beta subunit
MTIIVGIICKDAIVLASDSQTSSTSSTSKRPDAKKFAIVEFVNARALVAQAGNVATSSRAIEVLRGLAKGQELTDYGAIADMARKAMRQVKDELRFQQCDCSMEELRDFICRNEIECQLMIAYYFEGKPYIYTVDLVLGIPTKINSHYAAIGCGRNLGEFLLSEYSSREMDSQLASAVAVYTVETVKKHDAFCGGPTRIALIAPKVTEDAPYFGEEIARFQEDDVTSFAKDIAEIDAVAKQERNKKILENLQTLAERWRERLREEYQ